MFRILFLSLLLVGTAAAAGGADALDGVDALIARGRYAEATARADAAARVSADSSDLALAARVELVRGAIWQARGFGRPAVAHFQRALDIAQRIGSRPLVADTYAALASAHGDLGQWDRVLDFAERLHEADNRQSPATDFRYFFQRGVAFAEFHDRERATASLERALAAARALGDDRSISMALGELAATALDFDHDVKRALNTYDEALTTARRAASRDLEATWLLNSGAALKESGDFAGARPRFEQAIAVERASGARRVTPAALKNLAQVLLKNGDRARAKAALAAARREADEQNLSELRWEVRVEEAALAREETPDAAEGLFRDALDILEDTQGSVLVEQLRTGAWTRALASVDPYDLMIDFLLARGRASDAFFVAERGRARAFLETLRAASDEIARALPPEYVEAEAALLADISEGQAALRSARLNKEERRALDQAIRSDEDQLSTLRLRLASDRPAVAAIRYPELWHAEDLGTKVLKPNQALVMFFLGAKNSTMWVVDREAVRVVRLPPRADIDRTARQYLEAAKQPHDPQEPARAAELFRLLFPELSVRSGVDELIVVPDGILHDLPFEALRDQQGQRLIERFSVAYAPSASSFALLAARSSEPRPSSTLLAIGNPVMSGRGAGAVREGGVENLSLLKSLPFTGAEMRDIARLYGPSAKVLEGTNASEPALRDADLSAVSILHFATHGIIDEDRPERSGLVLTVTPPSDDGVLQMREVYALGLRAALVTLSACDTALGANVQGEGIVGLSRAFFYAGADAVVASLWSVNDRSTAALMTEFYRALGTGMPAAVALRHAKLQFVREPGPFSDPYYWAAFIVTGNGNWRGGPPALGDGSTPVWPYAGALLVACALIWRRHRWRKSSTRS